MTALGDTEDPPPNQAPVEMVSGERDFQPFGGKERPSIDFYARITAMEESILERLTTRMDRSFGAVFAELGRANTRITAQSLEIAADAIQPNGLSGKSVLLVEPDRHLRKRARIVFERLGMRFSEARSSDDGLTLIDRASENFDVALVNIRSPHIEDGIELTRYLTRVSRSTVAFVMGGGLDAPAVSDALDGLRVGRLPMPFDFETMYERIHDAVGADLASRDTERPHKPDFVEDDTAPSYMLPSTGRETPEAKRE